jgi:molecular chaperone DnaK
MPQIEVAFDIDANGILNVSAKDQATSKEQHITITASSGLSEAEIDQMVKDAETHATEDQQKREEVEVHNQADSLIYETEKNLNEFGDKVDAAIKGNVENAVEELKKALENKDTEDIKAKTESLMQVWHQASEELYKQTAEAGGDPSAGPEHQSAPTDEPQSTSSSADGEVIDADYEVVDEDKK